MASQLQNNDTGASSQLQNNGIAHCPSAVSVNVNFNGGAASSVSRSCAASVSSNCANSANNAKTCEYLSAVPYDSLSRNGKLEQLDEGDEVLTLLAEELQRVKERYETHTHTHNTHIHARARKHTRTLALLSSQSVHSPPVWVFRCGTGKILLCAALQSY